MDGCDVRVRFQQIARARLLHQHINLCFWKIQPEFVQQRCGEQRVTNAGQRYDENLHSVRG